MVLPTIVGFFPDLLNVDVVKSEFGVYVTHNSIVLFAVNVFGYGIEIDVEATFLRRVHGVQLHP